MDFHSHFSDDSAQNSSTTFDNMKNSLNGCMRIFFLEYGIIYDTMDRCSKQ